MSIVLAIRSEDQLRAGADWAVRFAETGDHELHVMVLGADRAVLTKHAESQLTTRLKKLDTTLASVAAVDESIDAVNDFVRNVGCRWLVLMHGVDAGDLQKEIFRKASCSTIWLCAAAEPPIGEEHLWGLFRSNSKISIQICRELLSMQPSDYLSDAPPPAQSLEGNQFITNVSDLVAMTIDPIRDTTDLIVVATAEDSKADLGFEMGLDLLDRNTTTSIALVRRGQNAASGAADRFLRWTASIAPLMGREQRIELTQSLEVGSKPNLEYLGLISAAAMLAAFGLLQDSAAVVIGAMLIAPLMTPILGGGLALTLGNRPLFQQAWLTILFGFFGALSASVAFGFLVMCFREPVITGEMWSRCSPSPLDFCVGLVGGIAAAYARTRSHLSSALAGAAIAAALVPPISTAGLQIAFYISNGCDYEDTFQAAPKYAHAILGPLLLVTTNVVTIMIGASFVLWARGIRADRKLDSTQRWVLRMAFVLITVALLMLAGVVLQW